MFIKLLVNIRADDRRHFLCAHAGPGECQSYLSLQMFISQSVKAELPYWGGEMQNQQRIPMHCAMPALVF